MTSNLAEKWRKRPQAWIRVPSGVLVFVLSMAASALGGWLDTQRQSAEEHGKVLAELALARARVEGVIKATFSSTDGLVHLTSLQGGIEQGLFNEMARLAIGKNPYVRNITLAPDNTIAMVYPLAGNEKALGFQFSSNPEQFRTVEQAREQGASILAGPVDLVQGGRALIQRSPVFTSAGSPDGTPRYWGAASIVAYIDGLLKHARLSSTHIQIAIRGKDALGEHGEMVDGDPVVFASAPVLMEVEVPGGNWQMGAIPLGGWQNLSLYQSHYFQFGLAIALLLTALTHLRASHGRELEARHRALQNEMEQRKQIESALHAEQERLKLSAAVLESTAEGVMITDVNVRIVAVNRAFTQITGYSEAEAIGQSPALLRSEKQGPEFYQAMWASLLKTDLWRGELWNRRKNGEVFPEWLVISTIRNEQNEITHFVGVFSDISPLKHSQARLEHLAHFDPLTELPNRLLFQDRLSHALDLACRYHHQVALLVLDLDGFKTVNDSLGHPVGDQLLTKVAHRLQSCVRVEDTVARLGGDEFAIILDNQADGLDVVEVVRKLLSSVEQPFDLAGVSAMISTSIGIAMYPADGSNATELVRNADAAMYGAKEAGRNTYRFYQATMTQDAQARLHIEASLRRAIEQQEFEVWFQPQISLENGRVTGAEALVRWRDSARGLIPPIEFIPLAERTGLILPIGEQVLSQVCQLAKRWRDADLPFGRLAVNVATPQIERGDFVGLLREILAREQLPADCLEIEITESFIMGNAATAREALLEIQALGVTVSVDDFGTGYSSLAYLKALPIDSLKIDRAFIKDLPGSNHDVAITRAIIAMAHSLGFKVIAEGIEDQSQQDWLDHEGCDEAQGFFISRPMPTNDFEQWLRAYQDHPK